MRSKLDDIEDRLRKFIESSVHLLPRGSRQNVLAQKLVGALQESLVPEDNGSITAPSIYTIFLHPDNVPYWETRQDIFDALAQVLHEAAQEAGLQFREEPVIRLSGDNQMPVAEIRVIASDPTGRGQTNILSLGNDKSGPDAHTVNAFLILDGMKTHPLRRRVINIGRRLDNHIVIDDPRVSRSHAQIRTVRGRFVLFDLNSTGGTFVNGQRISQHGLKPGDVISLSGYTIIYGEDAPVTNDGDTHAFPVN